MVLNGFEALFCRRARDFHVSESLFGDYDFDRPLEGSQSFSRRCADASTTSWQPLRPALVRMEDVPGLGQACQPGVFKKLKK